MNARLAEGQYYGCCNVARKVGFLVLSECAYPPRLQIPRHAHENPYFIFTLSGSQEELLGGRTRTYNPSTLAFHPAGEVHSEKLGTTGMRCLHVEFRSDWIQRHADVSPVLTTGSDFRGGKLAWLARRIYREFSEMDDVSPAAIDGLVLEMLVEAFRIERHHSATEQRARWLVQTRELILARFLEPLFLSDVATAVGVHPVSLARAFRKHYHCSVGEFIRQARIESACKAILADDLPLSEIALASGFSDQAHFARTFKRVTGLTPGQFRATRGRR